MSGNRLKVVQRLEQFWTLRNVSGNISLCLGAFAAYDWEATKALKHKEVVRRPGLQGASQYPRLKFISVYPTVTTNEKF